ncbi:hypothetical protein, partial [uncultured Flavobacterium sp.]|uniref:hypothetical protein n=1 Tax=uncultured Flavobacterium sp. TaxID=165435 RepID=UPI0025FAA928
METLKNDIVKVLQQTEESCGAYALTAALASMDAISESKEIGHTFEGNPESVTVKVVVPAYNPSDIRMIADKIYEFTGILKEDGDPELENHTTMSQNAPSAIGYVANEYLPGKVLIYTDTGNTTYPELIKKYPGEISRCDKAGLNIKTVANGYQKPDGKNIHIVCVN